jgi:hypothetical protein
MAWYDKFVKVEGKDGGIPVPEAPTPPPTKSSTAPFVAPPTQFVTHRTAMDYTLDEIFVEGGAATGKNSAETAIKLRDGLAAFPAPQQIAMLRAMDSADDSWNEASVVEDADARVKIALEYIKMVDADAADRIGKINAECDADVQATQNQVNELDKQIATLQAERNKSLARVTWAQAEASKDVEAVKTRANGIKDATTKVVDKYKEIVNFFGKK